MHSCLRLLKHGARPFSSKTGPLKSKLNPEWTKGVPDYMQEVYTWSYVNPTNVKILDRQSIVDVLLFFNARILERGVLDRITPGANVLQVGHTHGHLVPKTAAAVGQSGKFSVVDVTPIQAEHARNKLKDLDYCTVRLGDACNFDEILPEGQEHYDTTFAFMLLHEIPDDRKYQVVANMLNSVKVGGHAVWVEYHGPPYWYNPTRYFMPAIFRWLEPFALRMWEREIESFAPEDIKSNFSWSKETHGGNLYQVVVARRNA